MKTYFAGLTWVVLCVVISGFFFASLLDKSAYLSGIVGHKSFGLNCAMAVFYSMIVYIAMKQTTGLWRITTGGKSLFLLIYERVLVPLAAISFPLGIEHIQVDYVMFSTTNYSGYMFLGILFFLLSDPLNVLHQYLYETGLFWNKGNSWLLLKNPPKDFNDILPMFIGAHIVVIWVLII